MMTSLTPVRSRSTLSVPATDSHKITKALKAGADEVVLDLEDAVAPADKERARQVLVDFDWPTELPSLAVRVNAPRSPWCHSDVEAVAKSGIPVTSIVLPKVGSRADIGFLERLLDGVETGDPLAVHALVETASGAVSLGDITSARERLTGLIIGYADLAASIGRRSGAPTHSWIAIQHEVLAHARASGVLAIDGPHLGVAVDDSFLQGVEHAASLGFDGKWVIHPRQVETVNTMFEPSEDEIVHARAVLNVLENGRVIGRGAVQLDGQLVDEAMAVAARRTLGRMGA